MDSIKILCGNVCVGGKIALHMFDGREVVRTIKDSKDCGLYITYRGRKYFEYEFDYSEYYNRKE